MNRINVLQLICPTGMYGAERWILVLTRNLDPEEVNSEIAIPLESSRQLDVIKQFKSSGQPITILESRSESNITTIRNLCRVVREHDIDIIHTHGYKSDILGLIAARKSGIKAISTPHGFGEPGDLKLKLYILLGKLSLRFFDAVSPLSNQLEDELLQAKVPGEKIVFIRNAVDLDEIEEYRQFRNVSSRNNSFKIGYIGQLIPRKKIDHILDIFNQLWLKNDKIELEILGDGTSRRSLEEHAKGLPAAAAIHFLGFRDDRLTFLADFDLFVMSSSDEGIPRCMMEAIAMGVPVAAYDIAGVDQLIEHYETGFLADYGDKKTLQQYWERLLYDKDTARAMSEHGRQYIAEKYSGKRMADEYTTLYCSLLKSG